MNNSSVVNLALQLAAVETAAARAPFIEPELSPAALTKLRQFCAGEGARLDWRHVHLPSLQSAGGRLGEFLRFLN